MSTIGIYFVFLVFLKRSEKFRFLEKGLKSILSFAIADKLYIFATSSELVVYELGSAVATPIAVSNSPLKQILVATQSSQPFPGVFQCLSGSRLIVSMCLKGIIRKKGHQDPLKNNE